MTGQLRDKILADHASEETEVKTVEQKQEEIQAINDKNLSDKSDEIQGELTIQNYSIVGYEKLDIPQSRDLELRKTFVPMLQTLDTFKENRAAIAQEFEKYRGSENLAPPELLARAKRHRLDVAKIRVASEKARKFSNEEINLMKKANDKFAGIVKDFVTEDEKAMLEIEDHNEEIRIKQVEIEKLELEKLQSERFAKVVVYGFTDSSIDLSGMDESMFDAFMFGIKAKFEEAEEVTRKQDLRISRQTECLNLSEYVEHYDSIDLGEMSEEAYANLKVGAAQKKHEHDEKVKEDAEAERLAKVETDRIQEETRLENERLKAEKEESDKIEEARIKKEEAAQKKRDDEKEESDRQARLQVLAKQKSDNEAAEALEKQEAAEQRECDAIAETKRLEQELKDSEEKRIADIKTMTESSSEITVEQLERAKAEGKTVFVKVVSIEFIEGQSGIFITDK